MAQIIDCKKLAQQMLDKISLRAAAFAKAQMRQPGLAVVRLGSDPASQVYFDNKKRQAAQCGIRFFELAEADNVDEGTIIGVLQETAMDARIDGVMLELPLPDHLTAINLQAAIPVAKDVEGVTPNNLGKLFLGLPAFKPCTAKAAMYALASLGADIKGLHAVIVGASNIVGKPLAVLLLEEWATVEVCHIYTRDLLTRSVQADLLFAAAGVPGLIKADMVKKDAIVIDIGINMVDGKIVGDVDFAEVEKKASVITPVPGGIGALTTAMLLENVVEAAEGCMSK